MSIPDWWKIEALDARSGETVGYLHVVRGHDEWRMTDLHVDDAYQGRGVGTDLLWALADLVLRETTSRTRSHAPTGPRLVCWTDCTDRCFVAPNLYTNVGAVYTYDGGEMVWDIHQVAIPDPCRRRTVEWIEYRVVS